MKQKKVLKLLIIVALLQACATTISPSSTTPTKKMLKGSDKLYLSSTKCSRGIGVVRLIKDTFKGNKIMFNAKVAMTKEPMKDDFNVYNLIGENSKSLTDENKNLVLQKDEAKTASGIRNALSIKENSILFIVSDQKIEPGIENKMSNVTTGFNDKTKAGTQNTQAGQQFGIIYDSKKQYYSGTDEITDVGLSEVDATGLRDKKIVQSIYMRLGKEFTGVAFPETIENPDLNSVYELFEAVKKDPISIEINKRLVEVDGGKLYVQIYNKEKGAKNAAYNYVIEEKPVTTDKEIISVPTDEISIGKYYMNVFRSQVYPLAASDDKGGTFCLDVNTGFVGKASIIKKP